METIERLAFETDTINRVLQHDVVLYGLGSGKLMTFSWRRASGCVSPRFGDRELAVEWMANWLAYDTPSGDKEKHVARAEPRAGAAGRVTRRLAAREK